MNTTNELSFVSAPAGDYSGAWLNANWPIIEAVAAGANLSAALQEPLQVLTPAEARTIAAFAERMESSAVGAAEAGVIHFIDRALGSFAKSLMPAIRAAVRELDGTAALNGCTTSFADLAVNQQLLVVKALENREFFGPARLLALMGVFANPLHGGQPSDVMGLAAA
jgi:hypothetical protein